MFTLKDRFPRHRHAFLHDNILHSGTSIQSHQQLPPAPTLHFWPYDIFPKIGPFHQVSPFSTRPSPHPPPPTPTVFSLASDPDDVISFRWVIFQFPVHPPFFLGTPAILHTPKGFNSLILISLPMTPSVFCCSLAPHPRIDGVYYPRARGSLTKGDVIANS